MEPASQEGFGALLRRHRQAVGLTQEELAERAGLAAAAISSLERGLRQRPYPHTVQALADALGLSATERADFVAARRPPGAPAGAVGTAPALPRPLTPIIGRAAELATIQRLLTADGARLLTLTGPGGVGKTRLALEAAAALAERFAQGVVFVPLAAVTDAALLVGAVAQALGVQPVVGEALAETLHQYLGEREQLLVLDNLEQLLGAVPEVATLLKACPKLTLLVTSRSPLNIRGERVYPLSPLALPALAQLPALVLEEVAEASAVRLFVQRAQEALPTFQLTQRNAGPVAAICRRLDGLPLALELAAARIRLFAPTALLARLDQVLPLLTGGARDLPERQQTMRQTITWSYDLLNPGEQALFRRLAVFAGSWGWDAMVALSTAGPGDNHTTLDKFGALVDQSLVVVVEGHGDEVRYRLLEPIREYAAELLEQSDEAAEVRDLHAAYMVRLAESVGPQGARAVRFDQVGWLDQLEAEHDNLGAAMGWLIRRGRLEQAARLCWTLHRYWWIRGHLPEGQRWVAQVLAQAEGLPSSSRGLALLAAAMVAYGQARHAAVQPLLAEALPFLEGGRELDLVAQAHTVQGYSAIGLGDYASALASFERGLSLFRRLGDRWGEGLTLNGQAICTLFSGKGDEAHTLLQQAEAALRAAGTPSELTTTLNMQAMIAHRQGDYAREARLLGESLALLAEVRDRWAMSYVLTSLAGLAVAGGQYVRGARLFGAAEALRERTGVDIHFTPNRDLYAQQVRLLRDNLDATELAVAWAEGRGLPLDQAVAYSLGSQGPAGA